MIWGVLQFPGSCDERDALHACEVVGGEARLIWHEDRDLGGIDGVIVPGGVTLHAQNVSDMPYRLRISLPSAFFHCEASCDDSRSPPATNRRIPIKAARRCGASASRRR